MFKVNSFTNRKSCGLPVFWGMVFLAGCAVLAGCAGQAETRDSNAEAEAIEAAEAALAAMDGGGVKKALPGVKNNLPPAGQPTGQPDWVLSPYSVYNQAIYIAAVGQGGNRAAAERSSFAALTAIFGQSIQAEFSNLTHYSEAVNNGSLNVSENNAVSEAIKTSADMDSLIGAEIADVWWDAKDKLWYAAAVLEKQKAAALYSELLRGNQRLINEITSIPDAEKNTLESFSRYQLAAAVADANHLYANLLSVLGGAGAEGTLKKGGDYRLEAAKIARNISIAVNVEGDRQNRVENAFAVALGRLGFKSGGNNNRYVLNAKVSLSSASLPGNKNEFCRYNIDSYLTDTKNGGRMAPYNITGREGHTAMSEAEIRAINAAVKKIESEYEQVFNGFFSTNLLK
ncbi:MAG: LPP20 family lipoprotein [Spirochaetaceae bacterium]|jgi:hypothetical protein|nr:LPP20 family lipoprotein [Spirochaetaceae bacterium]